MTTYSYAGRDSHGEKVQGIIDRSDAQSVAVYLKQQHIVPLSISPVQVQHFSLIDFWRSKTDFFRAGIRDDDLIMFCRQMYTIAKAGLPLAQGIKNLAMSLSPGRLQSSLLDVVTRLQSGHALSLSLRHHPDIFSPLFVNMVKVGEASGELDLIFRQLADYLERDYQTKQAIKAAVRYPLFILFAMLVALIVVNFFVIPAFSSMFARFGADLPLPTRILVGFSEFLINYWWLVLLIVLTIVITSLYCLSQPWGRLWKDRYLLKMPVIGSLLKIALLARYVRSFSVTLKSGVPITEAIELCINVVNNNFIAERLSLIKVGIERGDSLKRTHIRSGVFSPLIIQMISVGEDSGQIDELLLDVAEHYEREVDYRLKSLSSKIEPLLIVLMAGFVLVMALGIFLPMWDMYAIRN